MATLVSSAPPPVRTAPTAATEVARRRVDAIDLLRGVVMVLMVLDHTRDFVHSTAMTADPTDLTHASPAVFLTRWVTHFCPSVFVFLAGVSAYLHPARSSHRAALSRFLLTRGLWLVLLEFTIVRLVSFWEFNAASVGTAQVIFALGVAMIVLSGLVHLPVRVVGAIGLAIIALHNLLDRVHVVAWEGPGTPLPTGLDALWTIVHQGGIAGVTAHGPALTVRYPVLPWIGVMALGYAFGLLYTGTAARRERWLFRLGGATIVAFIALRAVNRYGDPIPWTSMQSPLLTVLSFVNTEKYPPSLLFVLMTVGPAVVALALFERTGRTPRGTVGRALVTLGRVPLFFYLLQWFLVHAVALVMHAATGRPTTHLLLHVPWELSADVLDHTGFPLWVVYVTWIACVVALYPPSRWYAGIKATGRHGFLSYL